VLWLVRYGVADGSRGCKPSPVAVGPAPGCESARVAYRTEHIFNLGMKILGQRNSTQHR